MTDLQRQSAEYLLAQCTARVESGRAPLGTAFFVAPGYALTAAHVVRGMIGFPVVLHGRQGAWTGQVDDAWPAADESWPELPVPYPAPDVALIRIDDGPAHVCALLTDRQPAAGAKVTARGYVRHFDGGRIVTAETESFMLTGELETPDPESTLVKLGHGQANRGMSGAAVLDVSSGRVIGILRTSRDVSSSLGAWMVPAEVIWRLLPDHVRAANERFHREDDRWHLAARDASSRTAPGDSYQAPSVRIIADVITMITNSTTGDVNIGHTRPRRQSRKGTRGGR